MAKSALLVGASGLVGGHCLQLLLQDQDYGKVIAFVRKPLSLRHPKLEQALVDFDHLQDHAHLTKVNDVFCCLGTTIKKAGSQEAFHKVDFTYPVEAAKIAAENGAEQFLIITALGANSKSSIFYNRVKGEVEGAIAKLPFGAIHIFRPSLLLGERHEFRRGERMAQKISKLFSFLLFGTLRKYRPIEAGVVAAAMIEIAKKDLKGTSVFESDRIQMMVKSDFR